MAQVMELRVRADWAFIKFAYLPALVAGIAAARFLPFAAWASLRIAPCAICVLLARWGHHVEEWYNRSPLLQITETGLRHEDGGDPVEFWWPDIVGVVMHRRNPIPPWRTNGSTGITPPYWLAITVRDLPQPAGGDDGYVDRDRYLSSHTDTPAEMEHDGSPALAVGGRSSEGYVDRSSYSSVTVATEAAENLRTIAVWPRQVVGGLFALMRFAKELQRHLIDHASRGEIAMLMEDRSLPAPKQMVGPRAGT